MFGLNINKDTVILRQIIYSFIIKIVSVAINFIYIPLLLEIFTSKEEYGVWLTVSSIVTWFAIFDIGLGNGLRNKLTEAFATNNLILAKELISTTYLASIVIFSSLGLVFFICNQYLNWNSILNSSLSSSYLLKFTNVVFLIFFVRFIFQLIGVVYISYQKPATNNLIITVGNLIALLTLLISKNNYELDLVSTAYILMGIPLVIMIFINFFVFLTRFKNISPSLSFFDKKLLSKLFGLGLNFFVIQVSAVVLFSTSNLLVSHFFSSKDVVIYNTAFTLFQLPTLAFAIIMGPIWSAVTYGFATENVDWLRKGLQKLNKISYIFFGGVLLLLVFSSTIYDIWLKGKVIVPFLISFSMAIYSVINIFLSPYTSFINGSGKIRISVIFSVFSIIAFVPLAYLLSKLIQSPASIMFSICIINGIGIFFQPKQVHKIINKSAEGIWNK
jgi:O-antigen/teichoic acid export membrane protein